MKNGILNINQIKIDNSIYPRSIVLNGTVARYKNALKEGAVFPPILVGNYANAFYLIDGLHRLKAHEKTQKTIQCQIKDYKNKEEMFFDAVKSNLKHGEPLNLNERQKAILRFQANGVDNISIAKIFQMPVQMISDIKANSFTNTISGEEMVMPKEYAHWNKNKLTAEQEQVILSHPNPQKNHILQTMIQLLETDAFNLNNATTLNNLKIIHNLIQKKVLNKRNK